MRLQTGVNSKLIIEKEEVKSSPAQRPATLSSAGAARPNWTRACRISRKSRGPVCRHPLDARSFPRPCPLITDENPVRPLEGPLPAQNTPHPWARQHRPEPHRAFPRHQRPLHALGLHAQPGLTQGAPQRERCGAGFTSPSVIVGKIRHPCATIQFCVNRSPSSAAAWS